MDNSLYISVITPCYNGEAFIASAIRSVLNQPAEQIEMIVVNDGSTDKTDAICREYSEKIVYIKTDNCGAGHARNVGLSAAKGKWILFLDSDDLFIPNSITNEFVSQLRRMQTKGVEVIYTPRIKTDMRIATQILIQPSEEPDCISNIPRNEFVYAIYQKEFLSANNIRFYEYRQQDIESAFRYLVYSKSQNVVTRNDMRFYLQRENINSNTHTWENQVMHSVKARIYYDLLINHAHEKTKKWLMETVVEETHSYYADVLHNGYSSEELQKVMRNLVYRCLQHGIHPSTNRTVKRHQYTNMMLAVITDMKRKRKEKQKTNVTCQAYVDNYPEVAQRLRIVSDFVSVEYQGDDMREES